MALVVFRTIRETITVAYALGMGEVEQLGKIGTSKADIDRLCKRLQSKARHIRIVYEAGPCGYGLYRELIQQGFAMRCGQTRASAARLRPLGGAD